MPNDEPISDGAVMKVYQAPSGQRFTQAFANARAVATEHVEPVAMIFNGVGVTVYPDSTVERSLEIWRQVSAAHFAVMQDRR